MTIEPLMTLPANQDTTLELVGRVRTLSGQKLLVLPIRPPLGRSRGHRIEVGIRDDSPAVRVALVFDGRLAVRLDGDGWIDDEDVPARVRAVRSRRRRTVPADLEAALRADGLDIAVLPSHELDQLLLLVTESAAPDIREARVLAAVAAVRARSRRAG
jgi:hypothetical protein